jgi:DNA-binding NarL/FixJ family response regulator
MNDTEITPRLTRRETEIVELVCEGCSNEEIAEKLVLSINTVQTHIHKILGKFMVKDRKRLMALMSNMDACRMDKK